MSATSGIAASCPLNVTFYACDFGERFLGCCENGSPADTCTNGCPQKDLLPATFEKEYYDYVTKAACTTGNWWSCTNTSPPFLGCCLSNPCLSGCPPSDLTAAIFSQNQTDNPLYSAIPDVPAMISSTTSSSASTAASSTSGHTTGAVHAAMSSVPNHSTSEIAGGVVGGIVAMAGIFVGALLLYRRLKSLGWKGSDPTGTNKKNSSQDTVLRSPTVSNPSRQGNEASHDFSTAIVNPREESRGPIRFPRSINMAPCTENATPLEMYSATSGAPQEYHEEDKPPQELPANHVPLPEMASSDLQQSRRELPAVDAAQQEHVHPRALQPGRPGFRPYSPSSLSQSPQPYGLALNPHSRSRLSVVSSFGDMTPLARGLSPVSAANDDTTPEV